MWRSERLCADIVICNVAQRLNIALSGAVDIRCLVRELCASDKLNMLRKSKTVFQTLQEGVINFLPSVRFENNQYHLVKDEKRHGTVNRLPGYADRILCSNGLNPINYSLVLGKCLTSDHRPVKVELSANQNTTILVVTYNCNHRFDEAFFQDIARHEQTIIIVHIQEVNRKVYEKLFNLLTSAGFAGNMACAAHLNYGLASFYRVRSCRVLAGRCTPASGQGIIKTMISEVVRTKGYVANIIHCRGLELICYNVHAPFVNEPALLKFYQQLDQAVRIVESQGRHVIVAGDFNSRSSVNDFDGNLIPYQKDISTFATNCVRN